MFAYKVRKPAWGTTLKPKETSTKRQSPTNNGAPLPFDASSQLGGDPTDPHTIGGNLQRAILLDMIELRHRYCNAECCDATAALSRQRGGIHQKHTINKNNHVVLGSAFARFKECFRNARFGAMHTRTIPPRVDRGEYIQLLYSSCFYLLEESFALSDSNSDEPLRWDVVDTSHSNCAFNTVFAVFLLFTLHQTNVLPEAPPPRSHNIDVKRTKSGHRIIDEKLLKEAWSMLPIGINSDEDKLYRRKFRSPVRIDRWNYLLLLRLRDLCLARAEECGMDATITTTTTASARSSSSSSTCNNNAESWRCYCGLARDAAYIIDKMLFTDAFFEYCEYHGPHSLEGLAGSPNFYRAYFASLSKPKKQSRRTKNNDTMTMTSTVLRLTSSELNKLGNDDDELPNTLELQKLVEQHCSNLTSISSHLQKSRLTGDELQPKQRELVENTLNNCLDPSKYSDLLVKLNDNEDSNPDVSNSGEAELPDEEHATISPAEHLLSFSDTFSVVMSTLLQESLADFIDEAKKIRAAVVKENKARMKDKDTRYLETDIHSEFDLFDDFIPPSVTDAQTHRTNRLSNHDDFLELQQDDDEFSAATGAGQKALLSLLSSTEGTALPMNACIQDDEFSVATGAGKNALRELLSMAGGGNNSDDFDDESTSSNYDELEIPTASSLPKSSLQMDDATSSVASGMGMRALNLLLYGQSEQKTQTGTKRARRNTAISSSPSKKAEKKSHTKKNCKQPLSKTKQPVVPEMPPLPATQPNPTSNELPDDGSSCAIDDDDEASMNESANMGKSSDDEMSVVTEDAGRNALAKLLSNTYNV